MITRTLPAAYGFLACVHTGNGHMPSATFATRGHHAQLSARLATQGVDAVLIHPGADASGAWVREEGVMVMLAGEIYNRDEIHRALGLDADGTVPDAELARSLYGKYGLHAFRMINGRYAALLATAGHVLVATDHAASVPLYVRLAPGQVLAATEAKALVAVPAGDWRPRVPDARGVRGVPGLCQVRAGTVLDIITGTSAVAAHRTWMPPEHRLLLDEEESVNRVRAALEKAVTRRIPGQGRPLVVLSGGIDSSGVAALSSKACRGTIDTVSMGTDVSDEFRQARVVARHLESGHREITIPAADLMADLPHTVYAAESLDPGIIEYLLPLTALYRRLPGPARRILTGYGADIPLGGMHREERLPELDTVTAYDMATFDGLNEMSPVLSAVAGHWSTHPYWDRDVLDLLTSLEASLKHRYGLDKWVLRAAMGDVLPLETVLRPKVGVHEGSQSTSLFSRMLRDAGIASADLPAAKGRVIREIFDQVVVGGRHPDEVEVSTFVKRAAVAEARPAPEGAR